jgi:hypothetical protein
MVARLLESVCAASLPAGLDRDILVLDNASTDGSREHFLGVRDAGLFELVLQPKSGEKGAVLQLGFAAVKDGDAISQYADLECDAREYCAPLDPPVNGEDDVMFGMRFSRADAHHVRSSWHTRGIEGVEQIARCGVPGRAGDGGRHRELLRPSQRAEATSAAVHAADHPVREAQKRRADAVSAGNDSWQPRQKLAE